MAVTLPTRTTSRTSRRNVVLPGAENVQQVGIASDPGVQAPQGAFGGMDLAAAAEGLDRFAQVTERIRSREDAVDRAKKISAYNESVNEKLRHLETEGDFTDPKTVADFGRFLSETRGEILGSHAGSNDSIASLDVRLEAIRSEASNRAGALAAQAQRKAVLSEVGKQVNSMAAQAVERPESISELFASLDAAIDDMAPAMSPEEEDTYRQAGRQEIITSSINGLLARGSPEAAETLLMDVPGLQDVLTGQQRRTLFNSIAAAKQSRRRAPIVLGPGQAAFDPATGEEIASVPMAPRSQGPVALSPGQSLVNPATGEVVARVPDRPQTHTLSPGQKVVNADGEVLAESADKPVRYTLSPGQSIVDEQGSTITEIPAQKDQFTLSPGQQRFDAEGNPIVSLPGEDAVPTFGSSVTGASLDIITSGAAAFAAGEMSEFQKRQFIQAANQYIQPKRVLNPDTGVVEVVQNKLPAFVVDALRAGGIVVPQEATGGLGDTADTQPAPDSTPEPTPTETKQPSTAPAKEGTEPRAQTSIPGGQTVFELAGESLVTGPLPSIGERLGRLPLIGGGAPEMTRARTIVPQLHRDLIRVLQNNPRYAEGERQAIEKETSIEPRFFDNASAFQQRLIGIDDALEVRLKNALKTAASEKVGREERTHALNIANAISQFRESLMPPRMNSVEEAREFAASQPPGAKFLFKRPDGNWGIFATKGPTNNNQKVPEE